MTADFRLVVKTSERHPDVFSAHCLGDALAKTCLAHSWRTVEAEDWRLEISSQTQYGDVLQDAFLHFFHPVVVGIKNFPCPVQVKVVDGVFVPGK